MSGDIRKPFAPSRPARCKSSVSSLLKVAICGVIFPPSGLPPSESSTRVDARGASKDSDSGSEGPGHARYQMLCVDASASKPLVCAPDKLLPAKLRVVKFLRLPSSMGISPVAPDGMRHQVLGVCDVWRGHAVTWNAPSRWQLLKFRTFSIWQRPINEGMVPRVMPQQLPSDKVVSCSGNDISSYLEAVFP